MLECAGNGRALFNAAEHVRNAVGVRRGRQRRVERRQARAMLERAEVLPEARHVWFEAADHAPCPQTPAFVRSMPIEKAMSDVLLAHQR